MKSLSDTCRDKAPTVSSSPFFYNCSHIPARRGAEARVATISLDAYRTSSHQTTCALNPACRISLCVL